MGGTGLSPAGFLSLNIRSEGGGVSNRSLSFSTSRVSPVEEDLRRIGSELLRFFLHDARSSKEINQY